MTVIFLVGAIIPALEISQLLRKRPAPTLHPYSRQETVPYAVMITVLVTGTTYAVLANPKWYGGAFLIAAIQVLAPIGGAATLRRALWRIFGTVIGSVMLIALLAQVDTLAVTYLFGLRFIIIALIARFGKHGWNHHAFKMRRPSAAQVGRSATGKSLTRTPKSTRFSITCHWCEHQLE